MTRVVACSAAATRRGRGRTAPARGRCRGGTPRSAAASAKQHGAAEAADVAEPQLLARLVEVEDEVRVRLLRGGRRPTTVSWPVMPRWTTRCPPESRPRTIHLPRRRRRVDPAADEAAVPVVEPGPAQFERADAHDGGQTPADEQRAQVADDGFDLRQFRHFDLPSRPCDAWIIRQRGFGGPEQESPVIEARSMRGRPDCV